MSDTAHQQTARSGATSRELRDSQEVPHAKVRLVAWTSLDLTWVLEVLGHIRLAVYPSLLPCWEYRCHSSSAMLIWVQAPGIHRKGSHSGISALAMHTYPLHSPPSCSGWLPGVVTPLLPPSPAFPPLLHSPQMQCSAMPWCCFLSLFWGMPGVKHDSTCVLSAFKIMLTRCSPYSHLQTTKLQDSVVTLPGV